MFSVFRASQGQVVQGDSFRVLEDLGGGEGEDIGLDVRFGGKQSIDSFTETRNTQS